MKKPHRKVCRATWGLFAATLLLPAPAVAAAAGIDAADQEASLEIRPEKSQVYLHEPLSVTVTLILAGQASVRNIQYPRLKGEAFGSAEFGPPRRQSVTRNGGEFTAYAFSATLVPRRSGEIELGPAELRCDLNAPAGGAAAFFGGSEPRAVTVVSPRVKLAILPLPIQGRPPGFGGTVGRFTLSRQVAPGAVRPGEAFTVITRIAGVGNIDTLSCQAISLPGVRAYPPQAKRAAQRLTCEQVLVPEAASRVEIPPAVVHFFDPFAGRYRRLASPALSVALTAVPAPPGRESAALGRVESPPPPVPVAVPEPAAARSGLLLGAAAGAAILLAGAGWLVVRRRRKAPNAAAVARGLDRRTLAAAEAAMAAHDAHGFYEAIFRLVQAAAAARCQQPAPGLAAATPPQAGAGDGATELLAALFQECDAVRYGRGVRNPEDMRRTLAHLRDAVAASPFAPWPVPVIAD